MWVPLVENNEHRGDGADYFVKKYIDQMLLKDNDIDTLLLACTHYPLLLEKIQKYLPQHISILTQGDIVATSLKNYLYRHSDLSQSLSKGSTCTYLTTESPEKFSQLASIFLENPIEAKHISL